MTAYTKDILRNIRKNAKRFIAIMTITALGLTAFAGIYAACQDMYLAADDFYDRQQLFDIRILSTLGLTDDDVQALRGISGVEVADGAYNETVYTMVGSVRCSANMTTISTQGLNMPYVLQGKLPQAAGEIAVTQKYMEDMGAETGDSITIEEDKEDSADAKPAEYDSTEDANTDGNTIEDVDWDADVEIEEDAETPSFLNTTYVITGVVLDPLNTSNNEGSTAFRANATTDYTFFVTQADVDTDVYTSIYLKLNGLAGLDCYSDEYEAAVDQAINSIESQIMRQREQARYDAIIDEALQKIADAESTMNEKFAEADEKFADAWAEIEKAKQEIVDGEAELTREEKDALKKLADARAEIKSGKAQLDKAEAQLDSSQAELEASDKKLQDGKAELEEQRSEAEQGFAEAEDIFAQKQAELDASLGQITPAVQQLQATFGEQWPQAEWEALVNAAAAETASMLASNPEAQPSAEQVANRTTAQQQALSVALGTVISGWGDPNVDAAAIISQSVQAGLGLGIVEGGQQAMDLQKAAYQKQKTDALAQLDAAEAELADGEKQLTDGRNQIAAGRKEISSGRAELASGERQLDAEEKKALRELSEAWQQLADGKQELAEGEAELTQNEQEYIDKKLEAQEKVADAYAELEDIDTAQWYVQDRRSLDSYASMDTDLTSIGAIGKAFPVLFLVVAILISLTTMTRMVEEERGLIGTYKALGFSGFAIGMKYVLYAILASLAGGILGNLLGYIALPKILINILDVIYSIPNISLHYDPLYGLFGMMLFVGSNVAATALACSNVLRQSPATLMRPKSPPAGSRILLERIKPIWNRLKFLNKVTARNLFRYKKRLLMTVIGISGCTALVLAGFAIRDSVTDLMPKQYEHLYRYDLMLAASPEDADALRQLLDSENAITDYLPIQTENAKVINAEGASESVQLIVVPDDGELEKYVYTPNLLKQDVLLGKQGVLITQNAAELLALQPGDNMTLQNLQLDRYEMSIDDVVENYLGNSVYIRQSYYRSLRGEYEANAAYAHLADGVDQPHYAQSLLDEDYILTSLSTQAQRDEFSEEFVILNFVIYVLIVLAAGLAFVVLFTLSNTNISERLRELATIKVLGFYDSEVHSYANKETLLLTLIGVLCGLPLGYFVSDLLLSILKMPSIHFALEIIPSSYVLSGIISFSFALVVNIITNFVLDKINMVEALKSVE